MSRFRSGVQKLGRALMLPIAVLPVAGLLVRLGQPDLLDVKLLGEAGGTIFQNLPLLFAIGVALGFARDNAGVAGLAGAVGHLVMVAVLKASHETLDTGCVTGILAGITAGLLYNRYKDIRLPDYLAFFGGKRFVPIITGVVSLLMGVVLSVVWPAIQSGIEQVGHWLIAAGAVGLIVYGILNRLLIITGLHHILNTLVWFVFGSYQGADGKVVTGDLHRFFAGDPTAGAFMTGFFPVMMFGLPAACLAMYRAAPPQNRRAVSGLLLSMALTSFLTGITEPIEFSFMFLAPALYALHAVLTGLSLALMNALHVRLGFTFSAGLSDYLVSFGLASRGWLLIPIGLLWFALYYVIFSVCIRRFNLFTPGRDLPAEAVEVVPVLPPLEAERARAFILACGGAGNLMSVDACTTRLRLTVDDVGVIDERALAMLGAKGIVRPSPHALQVVLGPEADRVADQMRAVLAAPPAPAVDPPAKPAPSVAASAGAIAAAASVDRVGWLAALGGAHSIKTIEAVAATRLRVELHEGAVLDEEALRRLGARAVMRLSSRVAHVVLGTSAAAVAAALRSPVIVVVSSPSSGGSATTPRRDRPS